MEEFPNGNGSEFNRMRTMLTRAAEMRADEQRQLYEALADVRRRMTALENFITAITRFIDDSKERATSVQNRLVELPDRTEMSVFAERLDEALVRIDAQDKVLARMAEVVNHLSDRVIAPLEGLEARFEGVAGRFEGVAGRLDGLEDRLENLHRRLDESNHSMERRFDETNHAIDKLKVQVDALPGVLDLPAVHGHLDDLAAGVNSRFDQLNVVHQRLDELLGRPAVDHTEDFVGVNGKLAILSDALESLNGRVNTVEDGMRAGVGTLSGSVEQGVEKLEGAISARADRDEMTRTFWAAQRESEIRLISELDKTLAGLAEALLGRSPERAVVRAGGRNSGKKSYDDELGLDD